MTLVIVVCLLTIVIDVVVALRRWNSRRFRADRWWVRRCNAHDSIEQTF